MRATVLLLAALGCGPRGGSPPPAEAVDTAVPDEQIDGIVAWIGPLADAPPAVQQRIAVVHLLIETVATAPRPLVRYDDDPARWWAWMEETVKPHFATYEAAVLAHVDTDPDDHAAAAHALSPDERRLYAVLIQLVENHQRAVYFADRGIGRPAFGSCTHSPDESFGDALADTLKLATECIELSQRVTGPLGGNAYECSRRAEWSRRLIETGVRGVCRPPKPGRGGLPSAAPDGLAAAS
jgi:hypothetical protein